jgi:hypothetical protein
MIVLSDSDVVQKLAYCELLSEFLQYLKCPPNEVWVLPSLKHRLRPKLAGAPLAVANFDAFLKRVKTVPAANVATLERFTSLDIGERQLLSLLCDDKRISHLVTGDKRALVQISALAFGDTQLKARLSETSVLCFESVMLGLMSSRGFSVIQARVKKWTAIKGHPVDGAVLACFPAGGSEAHAKRELGKFVARLSETTPFLQMPSAE